MKQRCVICKTEFEQIHERNVVCNNLRCKHTRHKEKWRIQSRIRSHNKKIQNSIDFLQTEGYTVIPVDRTSYKIILEPMGVTHS